MQRVFRSQLGLTALFLILVIFSLACSLARGKPTSSKPATTRQLTYTQQPSTTFTATRKPTLTTTPTTSPTQTITFTPSLTHTSTATKTASPTPTRSATPTPTLSQAEILLLQAKTAMRAVNTLKMKISLTTKSGILPVTFKGDGVAERPDKVYIKLSLFLQNFEVLSLGPNEVYIKPLGSDTWEPTTPEQMDLPTSLLSKAFDLIEASDNALNPMLAGIEAVNGVTCQRITIGIDLPLYLAQRAPVASSQIDLVASRARGELWIGVDDLRIHKLYIEMEIVSQGESLPVTATIEFSGFNEPVVFPSLTSFLY